MKIYHPNGYLRMESDTINPMFFVQFERLLDFYTQQDQQHTYYAQCTATWGCNESPISDLEKQALLDFYEASKGWNWRINTNWANDTEEFSSNPCTDHWYGVRCNVHGEVISLHFLENNLRLTRWPDTFKNLKNLKYLAIFNGDVEFEWNENFNANSINAFPPDEVIKELTNLEEINFYLAQINGAIGTGIFSLTKPKYLNLAYNKMTGSLPSGNWGNLANLEILELQNCSFTGAIPDDLNVLPSLSYINLSNNNLTGQIPIFENSQQLVGVDFSQNNLYRWPEEYFDKEQFLNLEFCNANFNADVTVEPEICKRTHYCFKQAVL